MLRATVLNSIGARLHARHAGAAPSHRPGVLPKSVRAAGAFPRAGLAVNFDDELSVDAMDAPLLGSAARMRNSPASLVAYATRRRFLGLHV